MTFDNVLTAQSSFLSAAFGIALAMGAVVNKTNFCTMCAVSDLVNIGDSGRFRARLLAIAVALLGVVILEPMGQTVGYTSQGFDRSLLTFGVMAFLGVVAGSLLWSLLSRSFREEEAGFFRALVASLADFHLLPDGLRKLEKV